MSDLARTCWAYEGRMSVLGYVVVKDPSIKISNGNNNNLLVYMITKVVH